MTRWNRFFSQYQKDLKLWLLLMAELTAFRVLFILWFRAKINHGGAGDLLRCLLNGMRFDAMAATFWSAVPVLFGASCAAADLRPLAERIRRMFAAAFAVLTPLLFVVTLGYFQEYNDHFNHFIFNLYYDDTAAIASTIWTGYHPLLNAFAAGALAACILLLQSRYFRSRFFQHDVASKRALPAPAKIIISLLALVLLVGGLRGSFGHRPVKVEDAAVTRDVFLNKAVLNPYSALEYAWAAHRKISLISRGLSSFLPDNDVRGALDAVFGNHAANDMDEFFRKTAPGSPNKPPRHIFLVVMESYDAWPLMQKYASLGVSNELGAIGRKGLHVVPFLPASDGTATSLSAIVSGLPDASVVTNYRRMSDHPYATSLPETFNRLGYRTRFFYGGYLSWQKIGDFMSHQGFQEVYGGGDIRGNAERTEWGVEDEALFQFVEDAVAAAGDKPSFNMIMTTSYHPPYDLDIAAKGFPLPELPKDLAPLADGTVTLRMLGHLWYSDRCIGTFVRSAEKRLARPLFAFTGDHFGRKFLNNHPPAFEGAAVPFILYGRDVLRGVTLPPDAAGSHIDIGPTLVELAAPAGFRYASLGRNLLRRDLNGLGVSRDWVVGPRFLMNAATLEFSPLPGTALPTKLPDSRQLKLLHDRLLGIAWWRIMRGPDLNPRKRAAR